MTAPHAVMTTIDPDGRPHAVPVVFAVHGEDIVTPIDRKPKSAKTLGRRRNIEKNPNATLLAHHWSEEWTELAWVMVRGRATVQSEEESASEIESIVARYPQYRELLVDNEVIRIIPERISWWSWT